MKPSGGSAAERAADFAGELDRIDQILAGHLVIDAERDPAHRPVRLPLQLAAPAGDRRGHLLAVVWVLVGDGARIGVVGDHRNLQDDAGLRIDRQKRRIGLRPLLAQRRQHDRHHLVEARENFQERGVEAARRVALRSPTRTRTRSRTDRERRAAARCCARQSLDGCRTDRAPWSAACRDAAPPSPCSGRCRAPCAARPCRRRTQSAGS